MFSHCVFVCLCLYHDVCPDDLTMKDWCHSNNILQVHCWGCLVVQVTFHALMTSLMTAPGHKSRSNFGIDISPSIFELDRQSEAQNIGNTHGYLASIFNVGITSGKQIMSQPENGHFCNIKTQLQFDLRYENIVPNYAIKSIFHDEDVTDDVTEWPKSRPSIFRYEWNNIFHDN